MPAEKNDRELRAMIREIPDYPKEGILFYDVTTMLKDRRGLAIALDRMAERFLGETWDKIVGIESRGFIIAPILAWRLGAGFVPMRKRGKLPAETISKAYTLEYGVDHLEVHKDAIEPGEKVMIVDDLAATGGTAEAAIDLVESCGGEVGALSFLIELEGLNPRAKFADYRVESLLVY